ncbi:uncharacterized protein LOC110441041, partial [Mizuhopecten yessoensis]|uniref:uncharacterized protein LOC110441041 n=1 Tax=Mizuhopecten yessoensis TaxID=6573 RepID=UPI000B45C181
MMSKKHTASQHNFQGDENSTERKLAPFPFLYYPLDQWTTDNIAEYFTKEGFAQLAEKLTGHNISGRQLLELTDQDLHKIDIKSEKDCATTMKIIKEIQTSAMPELKDLDFCFSCLFCNALTAHK